MRKYLSLCENYIGLIKQCSEINQDSLNQLDLHQMIRSIFIWFDDHLSNPIQVEYSNGLTSVSVFGCIHYLKDSMNQSFSCFLSNTDGQGARQNALVSLSPFFTTDEWIHTVLVQIIPDDVWQNLKSEQRLYRNFSIGIAKKVRTDYRFEILKTKLVPAALAIPKPILAIAERIHIKSDVDSEELTLIWRNLTVYRQLNIEENKLIRLFHFANLTRFNEMKEELGLVAENAGKVAPKSSAEFDFSDFKSMIVAATGSQQSWKYLCHYGDYMMLFFWQYQYQSFRFFHTAMKYLQFLQHHNFPPPIARQLLIALFYMQGYDISKNLEILFVGGEYDAAIFTVAFHYFGKMESITINEVDKLLQVAYWVMDNKIKLDKNQKKQGWKWLVDKASRWHRLRKKKLLTQAVSWPTYLGTVILGGLKVAEVGNQYDLYKVSRQMRNCLESFKDQCIKGEIRFLTVKSRYAERPVAVIGLELSGKHWQFFDIRGFANARVDKNIEDLSIDVETIYNDVFGRWIKNQEKHRCNPVKSKKVSIQRNQLLLL